LTAITYLLMADGAAKSTLPAFSEWYGYEQAGKQLRISQSLSSPLNLNGTWTYDMRAR